MLSEFKKGRPSGSHKIQFNSPYRILAKNNNKGGMLTSKNLKHQDRGRKMINEETLIQKAKTAERLPRANNILVLSADPFTELQDQ